ncbi:MAG: hypothetical protein WBD40_09725 [Tepidisphaeraceae bacterium]
MMKESVLEYDRIRTESTAAKARWVVVAAVVAGFLGICHHLTHFALYLLAPKGYFRDVASGMRDGDKTDWPQMVISVASMGITSWALLSALAFLRGYRARRSLVLANWTLILSAAAMTVFFHFKYYQDASLPDGIVHSIWNVSGFVTGSIVPALVILFFGSRHAPTMLTELSTRVSSVEALPQPGHTPESLSPSR